MDGGSLFLQQFINGLSLGSIYALIALGYTMVYGIVTLINFAHGDIMMMGAYAGYFVLVALGATSGGFAAALLVAMVFCGFLGVAIERLAYRPLRNAPRLNSLITAIAVELILQNMMRVLPFAGPDPKQFPALNVPAIVIGPVSIPGIKALVIIASVLLMLALHVLVNYTRTGKAMRSVSYDMQASSLMGINVNKTIAITFAIGSVLAGAGGVLYASAYPQVDPLMGYMPGLKAFVAAVLGGIGSIPGAVIGAFVIGICENIIKGLGWTTFSDAFTFVLLIFVLMFMPTGIFGEKSTDKV